MDKPNSERDVKALWTQRKDHYRPWNNQATELLMVREGHVPRQFHDEYFDAEHTTHVINMIRMAHDDLWQRAAKVFPVKVHPRNDTAKAKREAEKVEQIAYAWNDAGVKIGGADIRTVMQQVFWWMVLTADACIRVLPDYDNKTPVFDVIDPRTHYPPVGWGPWMSQPLDNTLVITEHKLSNLYAAYPDKYSELANAFTTQHTSFDPTNKYDADRITVEVAEFYAVDAWYVVALNGKQSVTLRASESGDKGHPGVVPVVPFTLYSADQPKGRSFFTDQIPIQMSLARMYSQKLRFFDRSINPVFFIAGLVGDTVKIGPDAVNLLSTDGPEKPFVHVERPTNTIDADQMIQLTMGLARMLNRNPESFQGAGDADSAKAINQLQQGVNSTIQDGFWPIAIQQMRKVYQTAARMELNLWRNVKKQATGRRNNTIFDVTYTPGIDLMGYENSITVDPGIGLAGPAGTIEMLQLLGAKQISRDTVLEMYPGISDAQREKRRIQSDALEELMFADLAAKGQQGMLQPGAFAEVKRLVESKGKDIFEAVEELDKAGRLYVQPQAPEVPEIPGMGGAPPEMAGGLPPLDMLRGVA